MVDVNSAVEKRPRINFLPDNVKELALLDRPLSIGHGQTNSQPSLVRNMLELLEINAGQKVLDVGCGSGWTTALLSVLVGDEGFVVATELIPELASFAENNCRQYQTKNIKISVATKILGYPDLAPYDRILVSAGAHNIPQELIDQLSPNGGIMVIPVNNQLLKVQKNGSKIKIDRYYDVTFVPLIYSN